LVIVVDSISFQLPIIQLPVAGPVRVAGVLIADAERGGREQRSLAAFLGGGAPPHAQAHGQGEEAEQGRDADADGDGQGERDGGVGGARRLVGCVDVWRVGVGRVSGGGGSGRLR